MAQAETEKGDALMHLLIILSIFYSGDNAHDYFESAKGDAQNLIGGIGLSIFNMIHIEYRLEKLI